LIKFIINVLCHPIQESRNISIESCNYNSSETTRVFSFTETVNKLPRLMDVGGVNDVAASEKKSVSEFSILVFELKLTYSVEVLLRLNKLTLYRRLLSSYSPEKNTRKKRCQVKVLL